MKWLLGAVGIVAACGARTELGVVRAGDASVPEAGLEASPRDVDVVDVSVDVPVAPSCTSGLVKLADTAAQPDEIQLDDAFVYWHDASGVSRAPKTGGAPQPIAQSGALAWPALGVFALSSTDVYFAFDPTMIASAPKSGGPAQPIPMPIATFPAVATDSSRVYGWASSGPGPLFAMPLGGGPVQPVGTLPSASSKMATQGARGFVASDGGVQYINLGSGAVTSLTTTAAADVAVDDTSVYFTTNVLTNGTAILSVPKNGGAVSTILSRVGVYALALDATDLYFTDRLAMVVGKLVGKTGSNVVSIAQLDPTTQPVALAVDDLCVYFTAAPGNVASGAIYAAPK